MNKLLLLSLASACSLFTSCATNGTVAGQYGSGDDARYVQERRNRTAVTQSELAQHRRQRTDVSEEMDLDEKKRRSQLGGLRTVYEGTSLVRGIMGVGRF